MGELIYKEEVFKLVGFCMEIHREIGKGQDEVLYKDAMVVESHRAEIPFIRERKYEVTYKGVVLPHHYRAVSKLELGLLVNFGSDSLEWKRIVRSQKDKPTVLAEDFRL